MTTRGIQNACNDTHDLNDKDCDVADDQRERAVAVGEGSTRPSH